MPSKVQERKKAKKKEQRRQEKLAYTADRLDLRKKEVYDFHIDKLTRKRQIPINGREKEVNKINMQLEKNLGLIKALEEEYAREDAEREARNKEMESKGLVTLEDKINYLREQDLDFTDVDNSTALTVTGQAVVSHREGLGRDPAKLAVTGEAVVSFTTNSESNFS